jgi:hypothetical protein
MSNKWAIDSNTIEQMSLGLDLAEVDLSESGWVSPEEARLRSTAARTALNLAAESSNPGWFEAYETLLAAKWPWRVACYIAWAASPKIARWPETQMKLATEVLGLTSDRQITTWRKRNPAIDDVIGMMQAAPLMEHRADVLRALAVSASDPDHRNNPDRKLFLEMTGDFVPHQRVDIRRENVDDLSQMSEEDLERMARLAVKRSDGEEESS